MRVLILLLAACAGGPEDPIDSGDADTGDVTRVAVVALAGGTCTLDSAGAVQCVGNEAYDPPQGVFTDLDGAEARVCAVGEGGAIVCWGHEVTPLPVDNSDFVAVVVGRNYSSSADTCGIRTNGDVQCWTREGTVPPWLDPVLTDVVELAVGIDFACAVLTDGTFTCRGPDVADDIEGAVGVSAEARRPCVLLDDGSVRCPSPTFEDGFAPTATFTSLSSSTGGTCGLHTDGSVWCWDRFGVLPGSDELDAVAIGGSPGGHQGSHACALAADGAAECWGYADDPVLFLDNADTCDDHVAPIDLYLANADNGEICMTATGCDTTCGGALVGTPHADDLRARLTGDDVFPVNIHTTGERFALMDSYSDYFEMTPLAAGPYAGALLGFTWNEAHGAVLVNAFVDGVRLALDTEAVGPVWQTDAGWILDGSATSSTGYAAFFDVAPGTFQLSASREDASCEPMLAWPAGTDAFEVEVTAGEITFVSLLCH